MNKIFLKDPASAITHFIGMLMTMLAGIPLLIKAAFDTNRLYFISCTVFLISMILLYAASTTYHALDISKRVNCYLKKWDHMMICVLIAGTYTPICLVSLDPIVGRVLLCLIWFFAFFGILINAFWIHCPKWVSSALYICMGWTCILSFGQLLDSLSRSGFIWLLAGGIVYTLGGIIYAIKCPLFNQRHKHFGSHEIFHLFVMGGSACHFVVMFLLS